jgi:hypothetical protein
MHGVTNNNDANGHGGLVDRKTVVRVVLALLIFAMPLSAQRLVVSDTLDIGQTHGPASFNSMPISIAKDSRGRYFVAQGMSKENVMRFDSTGRFLGRIGRYGTGPGEFIWASEVFTNERDALFVFDVRQGRISVFDPSGNFLNSYNVPATRGDLSYMDDSTFVLNQESYQPDLVGFPLHVLRLAKPTGRIAKSFGATAGAYVFQPDGVAMLRHTHDYTDGHTIWVAPEHEYRIDRIDVLTGDTLRTIRRTVPWFPSREPIAKFSPDKPPAPFVRDIKVDQAGIWVLLIVPDPDWASIVKGWTPETANTIEVRLAEYHDTRIELLDRSNGNLLASTTMDEFGLSFLGGSQVALVYDDEYLIAYLKILSLGLAKQQ